MENKTIYNTRESDGYKEFLESIHRRFKEFADREVALFTTSPTLVGGLYDAFLRNLPEDARQHYTCNACRHFVERYGKLVSISEDGNLHSVMWDEQNTPPFFAASVKAMKDIVLNSRVTGVFLSQDTTWGQPATWGNSPSQVWHHMYAKLPVSMTYKVRYRTAPQGMAEKREEFKMLVAGLLEYPIEIVNRAMGLIQTDTLYRSNKYLELTKWLRALHANRRTAADSRLRDNITWLAVATAPEGFCHVKSGMLGTLLEDIKNGLSTDAITRRFREKMDPSNYMRAQVAPTQGGIEQAEKVVAQMGIADSLRRRYAEFDEIPHFIWKDQQSEKRFAVVRDGAFGKIPGGGIFGNIIPKGSDARTNTDDFMLPASVMTWEKFKRTVLPTADHIEAKIDDANRFMALVTAADETAPNILRWNNPFSWYYHAGIDGEIKRRVEGAGGRYTNNEIRCSLIWEGYTDLDLHCITPNGKHLYFGDKRDSKGGWLDVDANGGRPTTPTPVENIRWSDYAPTGHYRFYVHNYCERGKHDTPFKVELEVGGKIYTHNGIAGTTGFQTDVFTFKYNGQRAVDLESSNARASENTWGVEPNSFVKVKGITSSPNTWGDAPVLSAGNHVFFLLDGCRDTSEGKGRGFFTETLQSELREIRKTLEAYTANTPIEDLDKASACGLGYSQDNEWNLTLKVTSGGSARIIKIDRWD